MLLHRQAVLSAAASPPELRDGGRPPPGTKSAPLPGWLLAKNDWWEGEGEPQVAQSANCLILWHPGSVVCVLMSPVYVSRALDVSQILEG